MPSRYVDLSMTLENDVISDQPCLAPRIDYEVRADTRYEREKFFSDADIDGIRGGEPFAAAERVRLTTHSGTHVDAPWCDLPMQDAVLPGGSGVAQMIDETPLEWFFNPGVKLDFTAREDGYLITAANIEAELEGIGHDLQPYDIVVVNTAAGMAPKNRDPKYVNRGAGVGYEVTMPAFLDIDHGGTRARRKLEKMIAAEHSAGG